jgi:iron complex transport system ATP-binding protein
MSFFEAKNISFSYPKKTVLQDVNISIPKDSIVSLLGANGAGKSTLMKILLGLLSPSQGRIILQGKDLQEYSVKQRAKYIAYVPQSTKIAFSFSALEIVLMGRISFESWYKKASKREIELCHASLKRLGIAHLAKQNYQTLSGGQKQLVLIARALAQGAKILIMDEPISGLDYGNQLRLLEAIQKLTYEGYTFLKSTHFPEHALLLGGYTYAIKDGGVLTHGPTAKVVTQELINELYGVNIKLQQTATGYKVCVPNFYSSKRSVNAANS